MPARARGSPPAGLVRLKDLCHALERLEPEDANLALEAVARAFHTEFIRTRQVYRRRGSTNLRGVKVEAGIL